MKAMRELINEERSIILLTEQEESVINAVNAQDLDSFERCMAFFTEKFKADLKAITEKDDPRAEFISYNDYISFESIALFYADQIQNKPPSLKNNLDSSLGYGTFRAPWKISAPGAQRLLAQCASSLDKLKLYSARADNVSRLWSTLRAVHLYCIPLLVVFIGICLAIEPLIEKSVHLFIAKLASPEALPLYLFTAVYFCWGFIKLVRLKNFWGADHKEAIEIAWKLETAQNSLIKLMSALQNYKPESQALVRDRVFGI